MLNFNLQKPRSEKGRAKLAKVDYDSDDTSVSSEPDEAYSQSSNDDEVNDCVETIWWQMHGELWSVRQHIL
jgi:hypothetical protein